MTYRKLETGNRKSDHRPNGLHFPLRTSDFERANILIPGELGLGQSINWDGSQIPVSANADTHWLFDISNPMNMDGVKAVPASSLGGECIHNLL